MPKRVALGDAIRKLEGLYGNPAPPEVTDPYEMTILENVAYLVDDARRAATFSRLKKEIGLQPRPSVRCRGGEFIRVEHRHDLAAGVDPL
jgi:hypothetical protein